MDDIAKTLDSSSNQRLPSTADADQAWAQLTAEYLHDLPQQLDVIRNVLEVKDYTAIKKQAHRIKGTSGTYRLESISRSVARLEQLADRQNPDAIANSIDKLRRLVERETRRLKSRLAGP
ncbi:MAG TPA: Hpt domain-containing protein [Sedimentisphaerales bacterium]|nr:Hpt domain-containing protein [Sedimentisphaerales bacterium]